MSSKILQKPGSFRTCYEEKSGDKSVTHYCPGCGHGNIHKFIAEAIDELGIQDRTAIISPVGCSVFVYYYFQTGNLQVAHGRAPACGTGLKRANKHGIVISYQGDGDLAAIGGNEIIQAANRGEQITVIFVNNAIYGMTGGQMAPTTLINQKSTTSPYGRSVENEGYPMKVAELIAGLEAPVYVERTALWDNKTINATRRAIKKALKLQMEGKGFSLVEILSPCPSGWKMDPVDSKHWMEEVMGKHYPLGVKKDVSAEREGYLAEEKEFTDDEVLAALNLSKDKPEFFPIDTPDKYKDPSLRIAGFGGQGVLLMGATLAVAAMQQGLASSWLPSYGPEMRGGTANCSVRIAGTPIGSPMVDKPDVVIAFNRPSLEKFESWVKPGGMILYNSSIIDIEPTRTDIEIIPVPASEIADEVGNARVVNMAMLGAYVAKSKIMTREALFQALPIAIKHKKTIPVNQAAIEKGMAVVAG